MYPCPCCGFLVFDGPPGTTFRICPICFWQDDESSLRYATIPDGPNHASLVDAQGNFATFGACELRLKKHVRAPTATDQRDPGWRPIDPKIDVLDTSHDAGYTPWPNDMTKLYYWRADYWLGAHRQ
jgi:hypothetical protein